MAGFFNPNAGFDASNPQDYDYQAQAQKLAMMQALAQRMGQPLDQGKMVGNWFVGPSKGAAIASALQQALGGVMQVKGSEAQGALDKADRDAMASARKAYGDANDPSNYIDKAKAAFPTPEAQYSYKHPEDVGPPNPNAPQAAPALADRQTMYPGETTQFPMSLPPNANAFSQIMASGHQEQNSSPAPWATDSAAPMQQVGVAGKRDTFDVTQPTADDIAANRSNQVRFLSKAMAADKQSALDRMSRTKAGGPLANAIMARDYAPNKFDFKTVKGLDGVETLVAANERDGTASKAYGADPTGVAPLSERKFAWEISKDQRDVEAAKNKPVNTIDTSEGYVNVMPDGSMRKVNGAPVSEKLAEETRKQQEKQVGAANAAATTNQTRAGVQNLFSTDKSGNDVFDNAVGMQAKLGRSWSSMTGRPNDSTEARAKIETVQAQALPALMAELKASGASPTQMMNTEAEAKRVLASRFSIDPDKMSAETMRKNARDYQEYLSGLKRSLLVQSQGTTATTATAATPQGVRLDWSK